MRPKNRIMPIVKQLEAFWNTVPDWRFFQLLSNLLGMVYKRKNGVDPFYIEDNEALELMKEFNKDNPMLPSKVVAIEPNCIGTGPTYFIEVPYDTDLKIIEAAVEEAEEIAAEADDEDFDLVEAVLSTLDDRNIPAKKFTGDQAVSY